MGEGDRQIELPGTNLWQMILNNRLPDISRAQVLTVNPPAFDLVTDLGGLANTTVRIVALGFSHKPEWQGKQIISFVFPGVNPRDTKSMYLAIDDSGIDPFDYNLIQGVNVTPIPPLGPKSRGKLEMVVTQSMFDDSLSKPNSGNCFSRISSRAALDGKPLFRGVMFPGRKKLGELQKGRGGFERNIDGFGPTHSTQASPLSSEKIYEIPANINLYREAIIAAYQQRVEASLLVDPDDPIRNTLGIVEKILSANIQEISNHVMHVFNSSGHMDTANRFGKFGGDNSRIINSVEATIYDGLAVAVKLQKDYGHIPGVESLIINHLHWRVIGGYDGSINSSLVLDLLENPTLIDELLNVSNLEPSTIHDIMGEIIRFSGAIDLLTEYLQTNGVRVDANTLNRVLRGETMNQDRAHKRKISASFSNFINNLAQGNFHPEKFNSKIIVEHVVRDKLSEIGDPFYIELMRQLRFMLSMSDVSESGEREVKIRQDWEDMSPMSINRLINFSIDLWQTWTAEAEAEYDALPGFTEYGDARTRRIDEIVTQKFIDYLSSEQHRPRIKSLVEQILRNPRSKIDYADMYVRFINGENFADQIGQDEPQEV